MIDVLTRPDLCAAPATPPARPTAEPDTAADLDTWQLEGMAERLRYVPNALADLRKNLGEGHAILGFAGAPWTLFCYIVQGEGTKDFTAPRVNLRGTGNERVS